MLVKGVPDNETATKQDRNCVRISYALLLFVYGTNVLLNDTIMTHYAQARTADYLTAI